jgi:hypothetical protein
MKAVLGLYQGSEIVEVSPVEIFGLRDQQHMPYRRYKVQPLLVFIFVPPWFSHHDLNFLNHLTLIVGC